MLKAESYKRGLVFSTGLNIIARGVGFVNTLILAYYFGANTSTDIYFMVLSVAIILTGIINGNDFIILIPEAMKLRENDSPEASQKFLNFFLYLYGLIGLLIALVVIAAPVLFFSVFSKFDHSVLEANSDILYIGSIIILFQLLNNLLGAILSSYKYFTATILTGLINSLFAILLTVFFHRQLGVMGTISGIALGYIINFILLVFVLKHYQHWKFSLVGWMKNRVIWKNIGLIQVNNLPIWIRNSVTLYLLSGIGSGIITSVTIAQQITAIIDIILISQIVSVIGIKLSECYSRKEFDRAGEIFVDVSKFLLLLVMPVVVLVVLYTPDILYFFFSKKSFDANTAYNLELALKYLIIILPFSVLNTFCTRLFASFQVISKTIFPSIISHIVFLLLAIFLIKYYGLLGFLYSQILGFTVLMVLFYIIMKKEFPFIKFNQVVLFALGQTLFNVVLGFCVFQLNKELLMLNGFTLLVLVFLIQFLAISILNYKNPHIFQFLNRVYAFTIKKGR